ncbi:hypothetical protein AAG906_026118 [Vitis piasezkii]
MHLRRKSQSIEALELGAAHGLVPLKGELLLVYEYGIALGLASLLLYLHEEWEQCVVHSDIKSSDVMLDSDFNTKLGDFGLARLGYMAPECLMTGKFSKESDVCLQFWNCCIGNLLWKKCRGNWKPGHQITWVEWVWDLYGVGKLLEAADPRLSTDFDEQQVERLMIVGLWCAYPDCNAHPSMRQAISVLNSEALLPLLPIKIPVPMYYAPPALQTSYSTSVYERNHAQFSNSPNGTTDSSKFSESSSTSSQSASLLHTR